LRNNIIELINNHLDTIKKYRRIICYNEQVCESIIKCITSDDIKNRVYLEKFKRITARIKDEWGHKIAGDKKELEEPVGAGLRMAVIFKRNIIGRNIKRIEYIIESIEISPESVHRRLLLDRY